MASALLAACAVGFSGPESDAAAPEDPLRPHILLMLADDLGYANVGWHNPNLKTPALDGLVGEGVRLERRSCSALRQRRRAACACA